MRSLILIVFIQLFVISMAQCQIASDESRSKNIYISLPPHNSKSIMPNVAVSPTTTSVTKTKKKKHHHHKHKHHHHKKDKHDTSASLTTKQVTSYTVIATTSPYVDQITLSTSQSSSTQASAKASISMTMNSMQAISTDKSYDLSRAKTKQASSTTDNDYYFIRATSISANIIASSKTITSSFSKPTSRLLVPPHDHPMRDKRPLSSSSVSPSASIIQPIPEKLPSSSNRVSPPTPSSNINNINNNNSSSGNEDSAYLHKAQIQSSNRDLGLGLGLGFGGFSILALTALLIQNYKKRQRNHSSLRTSNQIDNNGVFFTEKPSMLRRKSASGNSKQYSLISTKWRPHSFLSVVANVVASKFPKRGSNSGSTQFGESGTVDYDPLAYPQPLYSPVKATYQDM
ncbi:hypothetical protein PS15p_208300 [Mucor circinelloides]